MPFLHKFFDESGLEETCELRAPEPPEGMQNWIVIGGEYFKDDTRNAVWAVETAPTAMDAIRLFEDQYEDSSAYVAFRQRKQQHINALEYIDDKNKLVWIMVDRVQSMMDIPIGYMSDDDIRRKIYATYASQKHDEDRPNQMLLEEFYSSLSSVADFLAQGPDHAAKPTRKHSPFTDEGVLF